MIGRMAARGPIFPGRERGSPGNTFRARSEAIQWQSAWITRRRFLQGTIAIGAALAVPWYFDTRSALAFYQSTGLKKFVQPLCGAGPGGTPVAAPDAFRAPVTGVTHYSLSISQFTDKLHPDLGPTTLWGYNPAVPRGGGTQPQRHLGGIIVAQRGVPIQLTFTNTLPPKHILLVDTSANFPDAKQRQNATVTHLHGGFVPWISDGGPFTWFTPAGRYGPSTQSAAGNIYKLLNPGLRPGQAEHYYPNQKLDLKVLKIPHYSIDLLLYIADFPFIRSL